jgi:biopolymer transport protein ExbD
MNLRKNKKNPSPLIDMTPIIDVVFQLLIFFMLTSTFIKASAINVDLPKSKTSDVQPVREAVITIYKNGNITFNDKPVTLEEISAILKKIQQNNEDAVVVIQSDKSVSYGLVIQVMDIVRIAGVKKLSLATIQSD